MKFEKSIKSVKSLDELQIGEIVGVCLDTHKSPLPMICEGYSEDKSYLIFRDVSERENNYRWFAKKDKIAFEHNHTNLINGCCVVFTGEKYGADISQASDNQDSESQLITLIR